MVPGSWPPRTYGRRSLATFGTMTMNVNNPTAAAQVKNTLLKI
jgi:hypothetical protein